MTLYKGKYRIESTRLKGWDYSSAGFYFVTICARDRECFFGEVVDEEMRLSPIGKIVADEWQKTPIIRANVTLDEWVVMPNHLHGIIVINGAMVETSRRGVSTPRDVPTPRGVATKNKSQLKPNLLGSMIGQFKSVCTKRIWAQGFSNFGWQERYHDHIIRNERALENIRNYIRANPAKWETDRNNRINLWM
ncbi:MAG: transposase [Chloroflexi bacterium]|nr:transposase [Chloroflexota bacterium]